MRRAPTRGCRRRQARRSRRHRQAAAPVAFAPYDPATGDYVGPDGNRYTQADLAHPQNKSWQSMLIPPGE